jgi:hypothetical protein
MKNAGIVKAVFKSALVKVKTHKIRTLMTRERLKEDMQMS